MDILNPHAILLIPANFNVILEHPTATEELLNSLYKDSIDEKEPLYVVFKRAPIVGTLLWLAYTAAELEKEFDVTVGTRFHTLEKI